MLLNLCKRGRVFVQEMFHFAGHRAWEYNFGISPFAAPTAFTQPVSEVRTELTRSLGTTSASVSRPAANVDACSGIAQSASTNSSTVAMFEHPCTAWAAGLIRRCRITGVEMTWVSRCSSALVGDALKNSGTNMWL